jgi:hypothetical protein
VSAPTGGFRQGFATITAALLSKLGLPTLPGAAGNGLWLAQYSYSDVIDFGAGGVVTPIIPPTPGRITSVQILFEIKTRNTPTVSPTFQIGANSPNYNDVCASQTQALFLTTTAEGGAVSATKINPSPFIDLTTNGLKLNITVGATATALTGRCFALFGVLPV